MRGGRISEEELDLFIASFQPKKAFYVSKRKLEEIKKVLRRLIILVNKYGFNQTAQDVMNIASVRLFNSFSDPYHRAMCFMFIALIEGVQHRQISLEIVVKSLYSPLDETLNSLIEHGTETDTKERDRDIIRSVLDLMITEKLETKHSKIVLDKIGITLRPSKETISADLERIDNDNNQANKHYRPRDKNLFAVLKQSLAALNLDQKDSLQYEQILSIYQDISAEYSKKNLAINSLLNNCIKTIQNLKDQKILYHTEVANTLNHSADILYMICLAYDDGEDNIELMDYQLLISKFNNINKAAEDSKNTLHYVAEIRELEHSLEGIGSYIKTLHIQPLASPSDILVIACNSASASFKKMQQQQAANLLDSTVLLLNYFISRSRPLSDQALEALTTCHSTITDLLQQIRSGAPVEEKLLHKANSQLQLALHNSNIKTADSQDDREIKNQDYNEMYNHLKIGEEQLGEWHYSGRGKDFVSKLRFRVVVLEGQLRDQGLLDMASFCSNLVVYFDKILRHTQIDSDDFDFLRQCLQQLQFVVKECAQNNFEVTIPDYLDAELFERRYLISRDVSPDKTQQQDILGDKEQEVTSETEESSSDNQPKSESELQVPETMVQKQLLAAINNEAEEYFPEVSEMVSELKKHPTKLASVDLIAYRLNNLKNMADLANQSYLFKIIDKLEDFILSYLKKTELDSRFFNKFEVDFEQITYEVERLKTSPQKIIEKTSLHPQSEAEQTAELLEEDSNPEMENVADTTEQSKGEFVSAQQRIENTQNQEVEQLQISMQQYLKLLDNSGKLLGTQSNMSYWLHDISNSVLELNSTADSIKNLVQMSTNITDDNFNLKAFSTLLNASQREIEIIQTQLNENTAGLQEVLNSDTAQKRQMSVLLSNSSTESFEYYDDQIRKRVEMMAVMHNKNVRLNWINQGEKFNYTLLTKLLPLLLIAVDNAIIHGIEDYDLRQRNKKQDQAEITINILFIYEGYSIQVLDDGVGLNDNKIIKRALSVGIIDDTNIKHTTQADLISYIFDKRFYTGKNQENSLYALQKQITKLGGETRFESIVGKGSQLLITLPPTIASTKVMVISACQQYYAIPAPSILRVEQIKSGELLKQLKKHPEYVKIKEQKYTLKSLPGIFQNNTQSYQMFPEDSMQNLLIFQFQDEKIALYINKIIGLQEILLLQPPKMLKNVVGFIGGCITDQGFLAIVIDINRILTTFQYRGRKKITNTQIRNRYNSRIVVVDPSIYFREVIKEKLEKLKLDVAHTRDVHSGIELIQQREPDIIITAYKLPFYSGIDFVRILKEEYGLSQTTFILLGDKDLPDVKHSIELFSNVLKHEQIESDIAGIISSELGIHSVPTDNEQHTLLPQTNKESNL